MLPTSVQPQCQLPSEDWGWVYTSTNNVALQLHLGFYLSPLHSYWNRNFFLWNTDQNNVNFSESLFWSCPLGKKTKQAEVKPNWTKDVHLGKSLVGAKKSDCSYGMLCVHMLPRKRQISSILRIFHFWGKLDSKQVPFPCRCILKMG